MLYPFLAHVNAVLTRDWYITQNCGRRYDKSSTKMRFYIILELILCNKNSVLLADIFNTILGLQTFFY